MAQGIESEGHKGPGDVSSVLLVRGKGLKRSRCVLQVNKGFAHIQLGVHQDPQVLFCQAAFQLDNAQHMQMPVVVPSQVQDFALAPVKHHEVPVGPFLQPVEVPLDDSTAPWPISHFSQFCVICKLTEGTLCPFTKMINEHIQQEWRQY